MMTDPPPGVFLRKDVILGELACEWRKNVILRCLSRMDVIPAWIVRFREG